MLAESVPSLAIPLMVNLAVVLPAKTLTAPTVAPEIPDRTRVLVFTDEAVIGALKLTLSVTAAADTGTVNAPPTGGLVEATASGA